jgi:exodeoxyribonuclease VII small subunit
MASDKKFETALKELEEIVAKLESTELPLEDSLSFFEKGIKLSKVCAKQLSEAEKKVNLLLAELSKE